jgi:oligopeptide/dipeptide ABC transporter ATP-binding protein
VARLKVHRLRVTFSSGRHRVAAVRRVDLEIERGQTVALVGESGAGKSTVANVLLGLERAEGGSAHLDGIDLLRLSRQQWRGVRPKIQVVFQNPMESLTPGRKVRRLVEEPLRLLLGLSKKEAEVRVVDLLHAVELDDSYLDRYVQELSGGEAQRVALARALGPNPAVIILDEPTASLDASVRGEITGLLRKLQEEHATSYLLITHDLESVREMADVVAVIYGGVIVEYGPARRILDRAGHPYTRALFGSSLNPEIQRAAGPGEVRLAQGRLPARGCVIHTRCPWARDSCMENKDWVLLDNGVRVRCDVPEALPPGSIQPKRKVDQMGGDR